MISGAFVGGRLTPFGPQAVTDSDAVPTANERESVRTHPKAGSERLASERGEVLRGNERRGSVSDGNASVAVDHPRSETCRSAQKGLRWYRGRYADWREKMGARQSARSLADQRYLVRLMSCPPIRYLAKRWRAKAHAARVAFERWYAYQYDWRSWLPARWKAIIACETFSNFRHDSGTYQGAFGFHYGSWDRFRLSSYPSEAYDATPRQQYEVALAIYRRFGLSGWGCA